MDELDGLEGLEGLERVDELEGVDELERVDECGRAGAATLFHHPVSGELYLVNYSGVS